MTTIKVFTDTAKFLERYAQANGIFDKDFPQAVYEDAMHDIINRLIIHVMDDDEKEACGVRF